MHLRLSQDAQGDLIAIRDYVRPRKLRGYDRVIAAIFASFDQLEAFPLLGRDGDVAHTRELTVPRTPYRIIYTLPDQYNVDVECVLHAALKYPPSVDAE